MREQLLKTKHQGRFLRLLQLLCLFTLIFALPKIAWGQNSYFGINTNTGSYWVTDATAEDVLGDGNHKITYDVTNNILTLNGINLALTSDVSYDAFIAMVDTDHPSLTVRLVGDNELTLGEKACFFNGTSITFTTDTSDPGTLTINTGDNWSGALFIDHPTSQSMNATYSNGLSLTQNGNAYTIQAPVTNYGLTVAGVTVTSDNASTITSTNITAGTVSYEVSTKTLTLSNATIEGGIVWSGSDDLKIALNGVSSITNTEGEAIKCTYTTESPTLTFTKAESATNCQLTLTPKDGSHPVVGFEIGNGLSCLLGDLETGALAVVGDYLFGGGDGSEDSPYLITSKEELKELATYIYPPYELVTEGKFFKLSPSSGTTIDCDGLTGFQPIGSSDYSFNGTFDGNGCTIKNLSVSGVSNYAGLFGYVYGGTIKKLTLEDCTIEGGLYAGGITGYFEDGTIENTLVKGGTITSADESGSKAGAIIGDYYYDENYAGVLSDNKYTYDVTVNGKTGYTHRGTNTEADPAGISLYTMIVSLPSIGNAFGTVTGAGGTYYKIDGTSLYVAPGQTATINATPNRANYYALVWLQAVNAVTTDVIACDSNYVESDGYWRYTFEMPENQVNINVHFAKDISLDTFKPVVAETVYNGTAQALSEITFTYNNGQSDFDLESSNFTITKYKDSKGTDLGTTAPTNADTYTVTIEGKGDYTGTKNITYKINPRDLEAAAIADIEA